MSVKMTQVKLPIPNIRNSFGVEFSFNISKRLLTEHYFYEKVKYLDK